MSNIPPAGYDGPAMPNTALVPKNATRIPVLVDVIDGFPEEVHRLVVDTGNSPLEDGAIITDHAVARAEQLSLTAIVSDQPGPRIGGAQRGASRAEQAISELRRIHRETEPIDVISPFGVYREMVLVRMTAPRRGNGLEIQLELEQVIRVGVVDTDVGPDVAGPAEERTSEVTRGRVSTTPGPPAPSPVQSTPSALLHRYDQQDDLLGAPFSV